MKQKMRRLTVTATLIACEIILSRFLSITTPMLKIGFAFIPIMIIAILFGSLWAGLAAVIADLIGATLFPSGTLMIGFTVTALLTGIIFGLFLHKKTQRLPMIILCAFVISICIQLPLNTYWLTILLGKAYLVLLPPRIISAFVMMFLQISTIVILQKQLGRFQKFFNA